MIQVLVLNSSDPYFINSQFRLNLYDVIIPTRLTYYYHVVPLHDIQEKILFVNNYICVQPDKCEKDNKIISSQVYIVFNVVIKTIYNKYTIVHTKLIL